MDTGCGYTVEQVVVALYRRPPPVNNVYRHLSRCVYLSLSLWFDFIIFFGLAYDAGCGSPKVQRKGGRVQLQPHHVGDAGWEKAVPR